MPPTTENRVHLFRLQILIIDGGLLVLRNILDRTLTAQGTTLVACLNTEKATITQLRSKGIITQLQNDILFPSGGRVPNTKDLDITLIVSLLRGLKCFGLNSKFDWKTVPSSSDVSLEADIWRLNAYRNKLCHLRKTTEVQPTDFTTWWNDIEKILLRLNLPPPNIQDVIDDYMTCSLDRKKERMIENEIVKKEAIISRLQEDVNIMRTEIVELKKRQEDDTGKMENMEKLRKAEENLLLDFLVNHGEELNVTRNNQEFNAVLVLYGDAIDKPIIHRLEKHVKMACTERRITNIPDIDEELVTKFIEMVSGIESATNAKVIGEDKRCIIIKFRCKSNEQLVKLLQYFDSDVLQNQLEELAKIVKQRIKTDKPVYFSLRLSSNCLERILEEIAGEGLESDTVLKDEEEKSRQLKKERKSEKTEEEDYVQGIKEKIEEIGIESSTTQRPEEEKYEQFKKEEIDIESRTTLRPEEEKYQQVKKEEAKLMHEMIHEGFAGTSASEEMINIRGGRKSLAEDIEETRQMMEVEKTVLCGGKIYQQFKIRRKSLAEDIEETRQMMEVEKMVLSGEKIYQQFKIKLKEKLVKFYKNKRSTVPLSPLVGEKDTPLAGFYVMPNMVMVKQTSHTSHQEERTPVNSLIDLFIIGSEGQQEIYLSADAGFGKTSFSKYLAITWSQACCPDNNQKFFKPEELKALANFEFVFLVLLRHSTAVCNVDEMIEQQIIKRFSPSSSQCPLQEVLKREKCLIILDGLDEWTHPDNGCTDKKEKVPHRYSRDNCVILTTTRPWKLGVSNLTTSDINKKVELVQLSKDSTRQLEKNAIRKMSGVNDDGELRRKTWEFDEVIASRGLQHMQTIPLLLMYITCLWCNKIPIGDSKLEVYINIIEFLLSRTAQKHPEVLPSSDPSHSDIPEYFKKHTFCEKFYSLLTALAELAYHTLFNEERENTLVFDGSVAENYLKADDMKLSLLSGILTGSTTTTLIERKSKISFSHKTVQELFAAIFISSQSDAQKTVVEKCENVQSILDMSTICEFVSKMNSKMMCEISAGLMSVINEDEITRKYRTSTGLVFMYMKPLYNIQKMLVSCLQEMTGSENIKLCLQDFFINKDTIHDEHFQRLLKLNTTNMKSLYYVGVRDEDLSLFLSPSLQTLRVYIATWRNYDGNLCEKLYSLKNVQYLDINYLELSHKMLEIFYNFICGNKTIKQLTLLRLYCIEHDEDCKMMLNLSKHSQLKYVHLSSINHLDESSLLLSRDMLNIERVVLEYIEISGECLQNMVKNMETISHLVTVKMSDIRPETEYKRFRNYIRRSQTFVVTEEDDMYGRKWFEFQTRTTSKE